METLGGILILAGAVFAAIAGIGQLRYDDVFVRIHVATKPATIGLMLVLGGALLTADGIAPSVKLGLAIGLQFLTAMRQYFVSEEKEEEFGTLAQKLLTTLKENKANSGLDLDIIIW